MTDEAGPERLLIVGLGNPGPRYVGTRHNVGFELVERLANRFRTTLEDRQFGSVRFRVASAIVRDVEVLLLEPFTYMNRSGLAVAPLAAAFEIPARSCLAVVDDMALPVGKIRFRARGSAGGHNGLTSIEESLGTSEYPRLRIGIGPAPESSRWADFVLTPFEKEERAELDETLERATDGVESLLELGIERTMSRYN